MTEVKKISEKMKLKEVAELDEILPGSNYNADRAWAKIEMRMEKRQEARSTRWLIIIIAALILLAVVITLVALYGQQSVDVSIENLNSLSPGITDSLNQK